jgi:hypothetical protein
MDKSRPTVGQRFNPFKVFYGLFIPDAIASYTGLSQGCKMCYGKLSQYAGKNGFAYPSHQKLAEDLGVSDRQVRAYLSALVDSGFICAEKLFPTNRYHFLWHPVLEGGNPSPRERKYTSYKYNQNTNTRVNDRKNRSDSGKFHPVDGNERVGSPLPRERKYTSYKYNQNTNTRVNDRKTSHTTANSAADGNDVNDGFVERDKGKKQKPTLQEYQKKKPIENVHEKAEKEFDAKELKLFKALINYKPTRGEPIIPREAYFWLKRYKYLNVVVAFEMFLASRKNPHTVGAYLCKMIKDNIKPVASNYDKNRRLVVDYNKKDNILHMMKVTRDYVSVEGREIDFRLDHNQFEMKFSNAVLR